MVTTTTTYSLKKPTVGQDEDLWGGYLNDSMDLIDDVLDGTTPVTGIDINSGTIDNAVIGGTTPVAGTFTTLTANTSLGVTGNITVSGTVDGVDIATRDGVLTTTTTTANAALPKAGGTMTGAITFAAGQTFDGRDVSADGAKLDGIESGATADQTKADIDALGINAATLDSLDSTQFLRSDAADTINNVLTVSSSAYFKGNTTSGYRFNNAADSLNLFILADNGNATFHSSTITAGGNTVWHSGNDGSGSGLDADTLDGIDSGSFLRSDTNTTLATTGGAALTLKDTNGAGNAASTYINFSDSSNGVVGYVGMGSSGNGDNYLVSYAGSPRLYSGNNSAPYYQNTAGSYVIWHQGNDGAGSGLDADLWDGNQFSSYLNQGVTTGSSPTFLNVYVNDWFRNNQSGEGMYNQATTQHWYSDDDDWWNVAGGSSANGIRFRDEHNGTIRGAVYATSSNEIGFLDSDQQWAYRHARDSAHYWNINNTNYMILDGNGLHLVDGSLREDYDALSGTSVTCNANSGGAFSLSMSGNTTFTFSSVLSGYSIGFVLQLTGNGSTVTWPSSVDWAGGTAPDAPASGETDIYVFWTRDGGTTWYGVQSIDAAA